MRLFIVKVLLIVTPFLIGIILLELFYRNVENDYVKKNNDLRKKYDSAEVLIFGNSHPFYGLNPKYFNYDTYNVSHVSQTLYYDKLIFDQHINHFKNLKCIILHIEYTSLSEIVETQENKWRKYYYYHYMGLNIPNNSDFKSEKYLISWTRNFKDNCQLIFNYLKEGSILNTDNNGYGINYTYEKRKKITFEETSARYKSIEDGLDDFSDNVKLLKEIIQVCKQKNIKVLLLTLPNTKYFYSQFNQKKLNKMYSTLQDLDKGYDHVYYYNLLESNKFSDDDFYDSDHLNNKGAIKSSKLVNHKLQEILN